MKTFLLSEDDLLKLLNKAYEEGWTGYKDLQESVIAYIIEEFVKDNPAVNANGMSGFISGTSVVVQNNLWPSYYYYSTNPSVTNPPTGNSITYETH
jgi:hypothetical protein